MNNVIYNNAYGLLGLLPNSTQKEITRRNKEIEKFLQIGEVPEYSFDFDFYNQARNLQNIRNAFFNVSNINNQILHHFFRVYANTETQLEILEEIENNFSSEQIIKIYENISKKNFIIKKNFAIILTIFLLSEKADNAEEIADYCINLWYSVIYNEKYIKDYKKIFLLDDELGIEESLLNDILESIVKELTKVFSDISKFYNNNQILSVFIDKFQLNDTIFSLDTVEEIYNNIYKSIKILDNLNISEDGVFDNDEKRTLKICLQNFQEEFNKLIDLGLYENEKTVILRDLVATKIRIQILDLFNNLAEDATALKLMQFALYIVGTNGLKNKLSDELASIESNICVMTYIKPLMELVESLQKKSGYVNIYEVEVISEKINKICQNFEQDTTISKLDKSKAMDITAIKIRAISIDLHNKYERFKESQHLLNLALGVAKSQEVKNLCLKDLVVVNKTVENRCGFNGFLNSGLGGCLTQIIGYGIIWLIIIGISALFGG